MSPTSAQCLRDSKWSDTVAEINAVFDAPRFCAPDPQWVLAGAADESTSQPVTALVRPVHSPEDVAWDIAEWLTRQLVCGAFAGLIDNGADELTRGLDAELYELDPNDLFQTFMVFYLTSADGKDARAIAPRFFVGFEAWLAHARPDLLARLRRVRQACVGYRGTRSV